MFGVLADIFLSAERPVGQLGGWVLGRGRDCMAEGSRQKEGSPSGTLCRRRRH